jgi:2-amino-4-hydroxy-6-hydroxymethyldihydropteridine diphosphokinase
MPEDARLNEAYLSLGSNIDPEQNLPAAVRELARFGRVKRVSSVWESPPEGFADQPRFLNAALLLETRLSAAELKARAIASIEASLGRTRNANRNAPRTIDIDIMLFNRDTFRLGSRTIPDAEVLERPFVAIPLAEIAPDYRHPATCETLAAIAARFDPVRAGMTRRDDVVLADCAPRA